MIRSQRTFWQRLKYALQDFFNIDQVLEWDLYIVQIDDYSSDERPGVAGEAQFEHCLEILSRILGGETPVLLSATKPGSWCSSLLRSQLGIKPERIRVVPYRPEPDPGLELNHILAHYAADVRPPILILESTMQAKRLVEGCTNLKPASRAVLAALTGNEIIQLHLKHQPYRLELAELVRPKAAA